MDKTKVFNVLLENGGLFKNARIKTQNGIATSNADVFWELKNSGYIYISTNFTENEKVSINEIHCKYFQFSTYKLICEPYFVH